MKYPFGCHQNRVAGPVIRYDVGVAPLFSGTFQIVVSKPLGQLSDCFIADKRAIVESVDLDTAKCTPNALMNWM